MQDSEGLIDIEWSQLCALNFSSTRGHCLKIIKEQSRIILRQIFFTQCVINVWNSLPIHVMSAPNILLFLTVNWIVTGIWI